jgi:Flp pilus assembly protein TadD
MVIEQPPSYDAYEAFVLGTEAYVHLDDETALAHWRRATTLDEDYVSAHLASALPLINLGRIAEADSVARWVEARGVELAPLEEASMLFLLAYLRGDREEAYRMAVRGAEVAPTSILAYQAAREALDTRRFEEAIERISAIDPTRGFMNGWVSYWTVLTQSRHALGDHRTELEHARTGRGQYPESMSLLAAEVQAQAARGRMVSLRSLLGRAAELDPQLGWSVERLGLTAVRELRAHGHRFDLWLAIRQLRSARGAASEPEQASDAIARARGY